MASLIDRVSRLIFHYFVGAPLAALSLLGKSLKALCTWIWAGYPVLPVRASPALSDWMRGVGELLLQVPRVVLAASGHCHAEGQVTSSARA